MDTFRDRGVSFRGAAGDEDCAELFLRRSHRILRFGDFEEAHGRVEVSPGWVRRFFFLRAPPAFLLTCSAHVLFARTQRQKLTFPFYLRRL